MSEPLRIGIAGLGTVGAGVVALIQSNADLLAQRCGRGIEIVCVSAKDRGRDRGVDVSGYQWVDDARAMAGMDGLDAVVELIGGEVGVAHELVQSSLKAGRHVVTANKALLAHHGAVLAHLAEAHGADLAYEAAVAGGIPAIKALREGLAANRVSAVYGILNGTSNYILSDMRETGRDFDVVLKEAQDKGYAEADPAFDVDGVDAGHKICLLAAIGFGVKPDFGAVRMRGIRRVSATDIDFAGELGYRIKLLGVAQEIGGQLDVSVEPCLVYKKSRMAHVEGVYNAVRVQGDFVDTPMLTGRGAGAGPTASAVVADILDIARGLKLPSFGIPAADLKAADFVDPGHIERRFYVRLNVLDQPGVIADVSAILRDHEISIESMLQRGRDPGKAVAVMMVTHEVRQADLEHAAEAIGALGTCLEAPFVMRIEGGV